jgi:hypothetical protein
MTIMIQLKYEKPSTAYYLLIVKKIKLFSSLEVTIKLKKLCFHPYIVVNLITQYDVDIFVIQNKQTYSESSYINNTQIQHCPISTTFHMWVDYDVPNWFPTLKNFYRSIEQCRICAVLWWPFWKWQPVEICWCQESIWDIISKYK